MRLSRSLVVIVTWPDLSTIGVEGGAAAALAGEGAVQPDDLLGCLVADRHVECSDVAAKKPG